MKRNWLFIFVISIYLSVRTLNWDLNKPLFNIKPGFIKESKEYAVFTETGPTPSKVDGEDISADVDGEKSKLPIETNPYLQENALGPSISLEEEEIPEPQAQETEDIFSKSNRSSPSQDKSFGITKKIEFFKLKLTAWIDSLIYRKEEIPNPQNSSSWGTFWPKRLTIRHIWGHQEKAWIPLATNFTTVELFCATNYRAGHIYPFLDLKAHRFDNNVYATNLGMGGRFVPGYSSDFCEILGFNAYYDYRKGSIGYYNQFGIGMEILGKRWDFRSNAYAPFGKKKHIMSCIFNNYIGDYYAIRKDIESVSYSFSGEIGYLFINEKNYSLYGAAGPYFLARGKCCTSTAGIEGRIRPQYKDCFALDLSARYDDLFGTIWQIEFMFNLPLYRMLNKSERPCGLMDWQIYQSVQRFEVMPLQKRRCWEANF